MRFVRGILDGTLWPVKRTMSNTHLTQYLPFVSALELYMRETVDNGLWYTLVRRPLTVV